MSKLQWKVALFDKFWLLLVFSLFSIWLWSCPTVSNKTCSTNKKGAIHKLAVSKSRNKIDEQIFSSVFWEKLRLDNFVSRSTYWPLAVHILLAKWNPNGPTLIHNVKIQLDQSMVIVYSYPITKIWALTKFQKSYM